MSFGWLTSLCFSLSQQMLRQTSRPNCLTSANRPRRMLFLKHEEGYCVSNQASKDFIGTYDAQARRLLMSFGWPCF
jgi:hypothetical protein